MPDITLKFECVASGVGNNFDPNKKTLLFIDDRPNTLANRVFERDDYNLVIIRHRNHALPEAHLKKADKFPVYYRDTQLDFEIQAQDFMRWCVEQKIKPDFLLNPSEPEQDFAHALGRYIGVPALSENQVMWLRNKVDMKNKFREIGLPTAEYEAISTNQDIVSFAKKNGWPVVIKPQDGFACINTYKINNQDEAEQFSLSSDIQWMVESFVEGTEWECCALIAEGKVIDTYISYMPARPLEIVDGAINANITIRPHPENFPVDTRKLVQSIVDGMALDHGYMHMEFFTGLNGEFFIGETALRLAGCEIPANHGLACNFNIFDALIDIHLGNKPSIQYAAERCVGDLLLPSAKGRITHMTSQDELLSMPGVLAYKPRICVGDFVDPRRASHTCSAVVHVEGDDVEDVLKRMYYVLGRYQISAEIVTKPSLQLKL